MQFIDNCPLYRLVNITGPTHNLLGLQISLEPKMEQPQIEALEIDSTKPARLSDREVAEQVMLGVDDACRELNRMYYVEKIQYVRADTPPARIYRTLAMELMRRIDGARAH